MSSKSNARYKIDTGGQAKYIKHYSVNSDDNGYNIDLSAVQFELSIGCANQINIYNTGSQVVYVAFDSDYTNIDTSDNSTYNFKIDNTAPFSEISISGEASKISVKCASGESTSVQVLVW